MALAGKLIAFGWKQIKKKAKEDQNESDICEQLPDYSNKYPPLKSGPSMFDWVFETDWLPLLHNGRTKNDYFTHLPTRIFVNEYLNGNTEIFDILDELVDEVRLGFWVKVQ